ncbi:kinase-like domain-containing protein [Cercophora newfieldiana]|uniref:Kinase-like domain-containing protein n=1 Tax=Cercophora newfieldiana TaxID=92897 RepID=A0AA39YSK6_9PEZI|nr:kinase-like domain-containing protein [Cercophora newfieldiana]
MAGQHLGDALSRLPQVQHISASAFKYRDHFLEDVEALQHYRPGGYHPVQIDDRLHTRYRIIHKLGHGTYSTAWLALDEQTSTYVAIKVGTPRCSLRDAKKAYDWKVFQLNVARSLAAQLTMAVSLIHSQGFAHGDLHLGNCMLQLLRSLDNLSVEELYVKFGAPKLELVVRSDGKPTSSVPGVPPYVVQPVRFGIPNDKVTLGEVKLLLTDFGVAFRPSEKSRFQSYTPLALRPPEAFFEPATPLSFASDIWSLGCVIFELLSHRSLINGNFLAPQDDITAQQVHLQGRLPPEWWDKWELRAKWFDESGKPLSNERDVWLWDRRVDEWVNGLRPSCGTDLVKDDEKAALLELLRWMLVWKPAERPSADQVLETAWMKKWALPAYAEGRRASE